MSPEYFVGPIVVNLSHMKYLRIQSDTLVRFSPDSIFEFLYHWKIHKVDDNLINHLHLSFIINYHSNQECLLALWFL